jgi:hypothetical protein
MTGPPHLVLGRDGSAEIDLRSTPGGSVRLFANVGDISLVDASEDDGRLRAVYTPPKTRFPQLAVIVAVTDHPDVFDWLAIPLHGQAKVTIESEPKAEIRVRVGERDFGPVLTNRAGRARLGLVVPPGISMATTIATDPLGNTRESPLELSAPPFSRGVLVCPRFGDRVRIFVTNPDGSSAPSPDVELVATPGSMRAAKMLAPGVLAARYDPPQEEIAEGLEAVVTASLEHTDGWSMDCRMPVPGEAPSGAVVTVDAAGFTAGGPPLGVSARVVFPGRRPPRRVRVSASADLGQLSDIERAADGSYRATWTLPDRFEGRERATVRFEVDTDPSLVAEASTRLLPAAPDALVARLEDASLTADGHSETELVVTALDAYGNQTAAPSLRGSARGRVAPFSRRRDGSLVARYTAPRQHDATPDRLLVQGTGTNLRAAQTVTLRPVPRRFQAAARLGYVTNLGRVSSPLVVADVLVRLPLWNERTLVGIEAGYYSNASSVQTADGGEDVSLEVDAIPVMARGVYQLRLGPFDVHGGGGVGAILAGTSLASPSTGRTSTRDPRLAFGPLLGAAYRVGPGRALMETAYWHAPMIETNLRGNVGGLVVSGGYGVEW